MNRTGGLFRRLFAMLLTTACATAPKPTAASLRIRSNPPAAVEGHVRDTEGRPAAGIRVRGIPRGADIPWSPAATTACDGSFRLALAAPGVYGFLLSWRGTAVITPRTDDPALLRLEVVPGESLGGVELVFFESDWRRITSAAPPETPSCP